MTSEPVATHLEEPVLAHIDTLAERRGVSREEMIAMLIRDGLAACEQEAGSAEQTAG